ncbi:MAG TPA: hypothetical protein VIQ27_06685 [Gemmatimonadales bacterium]
MSERAKPSLFDIIFIIWAAVIPVGFGSRLINSDGDTARHLRLGEMILQQGHLPHIDTFSFTMAGKPFIAFEWGSEVVFALAYRLAGLPGVAVLAGLVLALTYALVARFLIRRGGDPLLAYFVSMAAAVLSAAHWLARPHLFTMLAVVLLLELLERPGRQRLWLWFALFVVWANLHGGFFYGCVTIAIYLAGELLEGWLAEGEERRGWLGRARHHAAALGLALAASLVNPNGWRNLAHVAGFFGNSAILRQTQEFMSPDFHTINGKLFLLMLLAVVGSFALTRRRPTLPVLLLVLANIAFSLISQRNIELFALVAMPLLALTYDAEWRALPILRRPKEVFQREHEGSYGGVAAATCSLVLIGVALAGGKVAGVAVVPDHYDAKTFPVSAVAEGRRAKLQGRMFNNFIWGGYLLQAWPEQRVFIDGGTDHYGDTLFSQYIQVWNLDPGWQDVLRSHGIDLAIVSPSSRLAHELAEHQGWTTWYCDSTAVILQGRMDSPDVSRRGSDSTFASCSGLKNTPR